jgi:hypothetical protein
MTLGELSGVLSAGDFEPVGENALGEVFVKVVIVQLILMRYRENTEMAQLPVKAVNNSIVRRRCIEDSEPP